MMSPLQESRFRHGDYTPVYINWRAAFWWAWLGASFVAIPCGMFALLNGWWF